ncbi:MAG: hypothetical protein EOP06_06230 [Proteobacteria bacterium]|nr:MAG: hypothetical protein EOP06_06230 [Pseudomonadota bacterium]
MNDAENPLGNVLATFDEERATIAHQTLLFLLQAFGVEEVYSIVASLRESPEEHIALLDKHPLMCNMIMDISQLAARVADGSIPPDEIGVAHDLAALIYLLTLSYESHGASDDILWIFDDAYPPLFRRFLVAASSQIDSLCQYLLKIRDFFSKLSLDNTRIIIVELPIGNSLPVAVLKSILDPVAEIEHVQVSLSRNDKAKFGITREELLKERLQAANPRSTDIVLYLDEWNSGVNFNILCKLQSEIIGAESYFFPCAMLSHQASADCRYQKFCANHNAYLNKWGCNGSEFRQEFSALLLDGGFFWAENDRIAGWRKLQLHGSMFSSIDASIQLLKSDSDALNEAISLSLAELASRKKLPTSPSKAFHMLREKFLESCEVYESRRDEFRSCAESLASGGIVEDLGSALEEMFEVYRNAGFEEGGEKTAIHVALAYAMRMGSVDPADRFYFKNHAPILVSLEGRMRRPHDLTMEYIQCRLKQMDL